VLAYQQDQKYFAQIAEGIEELGAEEIGRLGAVAVRTSFCGLHFEADPAALYRINYQSRMISRVLAPLIRFSCYDTDRLYRMARQVPWKAIMGVNQTLAVFANVSNSKIRHSQYAALCHKDAIVDYFREDCGRRPDVRRIDPDVWISLFIENNRATISLDTSGGSLHRRGYRTDGGTAAMQETVAAAIIRWTEWEGSRPLVDPMCGAGTLLAEALMHHCHIPAGFLRRHFGFEQLPDFDRRLWSAVKTKADRAIRPPSAGLISGSDSSAAAVQTARSNLRRLPHGASIRIDTSDFKQRQDLCDRVIVCNPPYGIRLRPKGGTEAFYRDIGDYLKQRCAGATAFIYFGDRELLKHIGLKPSWKRPIKNGGLDGRLAKFEMYTGGNTTRQRQPALPETGGVSAKSNRRPPRRP
jgi:putative N6-adenine-specific DNA methylase